MNQKGIAHIPILLVGLLFTGGLVTTAVADSSGPGDLLYPLDLKLEETRLKLTSPENRTKLKVEFASERLLEAGKVVQNDGDEDELVFVLKKYDDTKKELKVEGPSVFADLINAENDFVKMIDGLEGKYKLRVRVKDGETRIKFRGSSDRADVIEEILDAEEEISKAKEKIEDAKADGKEVTLSENTLVEAESVLQKAKDALDSDDLETAEELAEEAHDLAQISRMKYLGKTESDVFDEDDEMDLEDEDEDEDEDMDFDDEDEDEDDEDEDEDDEDEDEDDEDEDGDDEDEDEDDEDEDEDDEDEDDED